MAKEAKIRIDIDTKKAQRATGDLDKSVGEFTNSTQRATTRLREMQDELVNLEPGSERFRELAREAGQLQDQINKARSEIRSFSEDTFALQGTVGVIQGVTSAYSSATATMALFGAESEELIQVFARLELIQRSVNGLIQTYTTFQRGSAAMTFLQTTRTRLLNVAKGAGNQIDQLALRLTGQNTVATQAQTVATNQATFATRALGTAMKALPIFAVIGGIVALGSALFSSSKDTEEANRKLEEYRETQRLLAEEKQEFRNEVSRQSGEFANLIGQLKLTNSGSKERLDIIKELNGNYGQTLSDIKDEADFLNQVNLALDDYVELQTNKTQLSKNQKDLNDLLAEEIRLNEEVKRDYDQINDLAIKKGISFGEASRRLSLTDVTYRNNLESLRLLREEMDQVISSSFDLKNENDELTKSYREQQETLREEALEQRKAEEARREAARRRAEAARKEREDLKETFRVQQFELLKVNNLREEQIKEAIENNSFERTFFGEADPTGRLKEIYNKLESENSEALKNIIKIADETGKSIGGALGAKMREKVIWDELLKLDEFQEVMGKSVIDIIDETQSKLPETFNNITDLINQQYDDELKLLEEKQKSKLISENEFNEEVYKLEQKRVKRLQDLNKELERINTQFNDRRNQATREMFDLEIRELELLGEQESIIRQKQLENRFDEERKRYGELFGRNSEEYKKLIQIQAQELDDLQFKLDNESRERRMNSLSQDLRSIRMMSDTTAFAIRDAMDGSFESMRFGFNSLRDQLLDPDTGINALLQSFQEGILKTNQLILSGLELGLSAFDTMMESRGRKNTERLNAQFEEETSALKSQLAERQISQQQFDDRMQDLEDQKRVKEIAEQRKQFNREKAVNLSMAAINTAQAILQAIAQFGPPPSPAGIVGIASAGAIGGVQAGLIAGQQFRAARGGIVPGEGPSNRDSVPALLAPGEAVINAQSTQMFPQLLSTINKIGGGVSLAPDIGETKTAVLEKNDKPVKAYVVWDEIKEKMDFIDRSDSMNTFR